MTRYGQMQLSGMHAGRQFMVRDYTVFSASLETIVKISVD